MRLLMTLGFLTITSGAFSGTDFGSIKFHSSVPEDQVRAMSKDLQYLFSSPVTKPDEELKALLGLSENNGPQMHNWLVNRVRHIIGESYDPFANAKAFTGFNYPQTPIPVLGSEALVAKDEATNTMTVVMTNVGSALYLSGKMGRTIGGKPTQIVYALDLDGEVTYATSPRAGIIQVGEGLFSEKFQVSKDVFAPANSISRLGTFFHEARHSDGNGKATAFSHNLCPEAHIYAGNYACEKSSNGSYSVGALTIRNLLANCSTCSEKEKSSLEISVIDSMLRILGGFTNRVLISINQDQKKQYQEILTAYQSLLPKATAEQTVLIEKEIKKLTDAIAQIERHIIVLMKGVNAVPEKLNDAPEGLFEPVSLQDSVRAMLSSKLK